MLLPPASHSSGSHSSGSSRFGRKRRRLRKLAVVCRILSALCVVGALAIFASSFFVASGMRGKEVALRQRKVSAVFFAVSPTLLVLGVGFDWWKHRFYGRGQRRHSDASDHGHGNGQSAGAAHAADLPSR